MIFGSLLKLSELHFPQLQTELFSLNELMLKNLLKKEPSRSTFPFYPNSPAGGQELAQLKAELWSEFSSTAPLPQRLWEGNMGVMERMTQI